jgi:hypothetical protein
MISKLYVLTYLEDHYTKNTEKIYKGLGLNCPLQFVPSLATLSIQKKKDFYKKNHIRHDPSYTWKESSLIKQKPLPNYEEVENAVDHWNIWNSIQYDISRGLFETDTGCFLIINSSVAYNKSIGNSSVALQYLMNDLHTQLILQDWDVVFLSFKDSQSKKMSALDTITITTRVGIPPPQVKFDDAYLLSYRGLAKLISSNYHYNIRPIDEYLHNKQNELFKLYYSTVPIFVRNMANEAPTTIQFKFTSEDFYSFNYIDRQYDFFILVSKTLTNEEFFYLNQYTTRYGITVIEVDDPNGIHGCSSRNYSIFYTLFHIYNEIPNPEKTIVLYVGKPNIYLNVSPSTLLTRFISLGCKTMHTQYEIVNSLWMANLSCFHIKNEWSISTFQRIETDYYFMMKFDIGRKLFMDYTRLPEKIDSENLFNDGISFYNGDDTEKVKPCILYSETNSLDGWYIMNRLKYYDEYNGNHYISLIPTIQYSLLPPMNGIYMLQTGELQLFVPITPLFVKGITDYPLKLWFKTLTRAFSIPKETVEDIRQLYHNNIVNRKEPFDQNFIPYQWATKRTSLKLHVVFYSKYIESLKEFNKELNRVIQDISTEYMTIECISINSTQYMFHNYLNTQDKHGQVDYIWFVDPMHVLTPEIVSKIIQTQKTIITPCIYGFKNRSSTSVAFNDLKDDNSPCQTMDFNDIIQRTRVGIWNVVHIQGTWCIHSTLFQRITRILGTEKRVGNESWEIYIMRVLRKNNITVWLCNRFDYGFDMAL